MTTLELTQPPVVETRSQDHNLPYSVDAAPMEHDAIAQLAYSYWQARGCPDGSSEQDWLQAEQALQFEALASKVAS